MSRDAEAAAPGENREIDVIFAPDFREGCPYQQLLADALQPCGINVRFLSWYRRVMPLWRGTHDFGPGLPLHLHWPHPYLGRTSRLRHLLQTWRFPFDLSLACRKRPLIVTAHNLYPHNRSQEAAVRRAVKSFYRRADAVIVHSDSAAEQIAGEFGVGSERIHVIPQGSTGDELGEPISRDTAREQMNLPLNEPICLMFGVIDRYKGIEEVVRYWQVQSPSALLVLAGKPVTDEYQREMTQLIGDASNIRLLPEFFSPEHLAALISAADCCLFNYREILNSGSILIPRSWGIPVLLPERLGTLALGEPNPRVVRFGNFDTDFPARLQQALDAGRDYQAAKSWRDETSWRVAARRTAEIYWKLQ